MTARRCGGCTLCCVASEVPALAKPPGVACRFLTDRRDGCTLHGTRQQPPQCQTYRCAWLAGVGDEADRPDRIGLFGGSPVEIDGHAWAVAVETGGGMTSWDAWVAAFAQAVPYPILIASAGQSYPRDIGDLVAVRADLLPRTRRLRGDLVRFLPQNVGLYRLRIDDGGNGRV